MVKDPLRPLVSIQYIIQTRGVNLLPPGPPAVHSPMATSNCSMTDDLLEKWGAVAEGGAVAEWVRALALNGDRTFPAGFDSHCGRL